VRHRDVAAQRKTGVSHGHVHLCELLDDLLPPMVKPTETARSRGMGWGRGVAETSLVVRIPSRSQNEGARGGASGTRSSWHCRYVKREYHRHAKGDVSDSARKVGDPCMTLARFGMTCQGLHHVGGVKTAITSIQRLTQRHYTSGCRLPREMATKAYEFDGENCNLTCIVEPKIAPEVCAAFLS
jgi:hypothetical protein